MSPSRTYADLSKLIDHAVLAPNSTEAELEQGIELARVYQVASVCILPYYVPRAAEALRGSSVRATTTIGFPHGAASARAKLAEAEQALCDGAEELDVVVNVSQVLSGRWNAVRAELVALVDLCHHGQAKLKLIFENAFLEDEHKVRLCQLASELEVDWVKTSTGFAGSGATLPDVSLMRREAAPSVGVKAAGGIRDLDTLLSFAPLVTRIGTSHTRVILDEWRSRLGLPALGSGSGSMRPPPAY